MCSRSMMFSLYPMRSHCIPILFFLAIAAVNAQIYTAVPRWGQASAIIYDTLLVHGGKTDPTHQYTYTSAPNSNDLLALDLSSPFSLSAPPWSYVSGSLSNSTSQGPAVAFHTLTPYTSSQLLLFGGDPGFATISTNPDSAWLLNVADHHSPVWSSESAGWASEPMRRIYHAASSASGAVYIMGGQKGDDSQLGFLDSYLFNAVGNGGSPVFISLSDSNSNPAHLFGHAAHVLPDGRLLVLGGFFASSNTPNPLTAVYILDTTSRSPSWSVYNVSGTAPSPRRNFASAMLENGKILIHGGADATLQTLYNDGALLDTAKGSLSWSPASGLSDALGARVCHFAVPNHNRVLFGFGWSGSAPASTDLVLYDVGSSSVAPSFVPSSTSPSVTTLPASPTVPGGIYPNSGGGKGTGSRPTSASGSSPNPSSSNAGGGQGSDGNHPSKSNVVGLVLGTTFGILTLVAVTGSAYYVIRRRGYHITSGSANSGHNAEGRWQLMHDGQTWDPNESLIFPGGLQMAGTGWQEQANRRWGLLGLSALVGAVTGKGNDQARQRFDMLADEDARLFDVNGAFGGYEDGWYARNMSVRRRREGTGGSSLSSGAIGIGKSAWSVMNASMTSLRNVGVALGISSAATAARNRGQYVNSPPWLEKSELPLNPFSDNAAVQRDVETSMLATGVRSPRGRERSMSSDASHLTIDPFSDDVDDGHLELRVEAFDNLFDPPHDEVTASTLGGGPSSQASLPHSVGSAVVAIPQPNTSSSTETHEARSTQTVDSQAGTTPALSSSHLSTNQNSSSASSLPRTTSIIGATSEIAAPMRRSDSWWARFSRTSFRDRYSSPDAVHSSRSSGDGLIEFRDPNPPPRLGPIEESTASNFSTPPSPPGTSQNKRQGRTSGSGYAASTHSSVKTEHTADSEMIERMGGHIEVVQRALSLRSRRTGSSVITDSPVALEDTGKWGLYTVDTSDSDAGHRESWAELNTQTEISTMDSPIDVENVSPGSSMGGVESAPESSAPPPATRRPPRRTLTGAVAARVSAYERRLSQEIPVNPPLRSPPHSPRTHQAEAKRSNDVGYGLVPKAALYVANPDRRNPTGSS